MSEPLPPPTTFARELDEYLRHTATRMAQMEIELGQYRQPHRMDALSDAACAQLRLWIETLSGIRRVRQDCGRSRGGGEWQLREIGSFPPFPVQLSYRWLTDDGNEVAGPEAPAHGAEACAPSA